MSPTSQPPTPPAPPRIGVFDSGVGGLSVLRSLHRLMPQAALTYVADSGHAPYGERNDSFVVERSRRIADHLVRHESVQMLVVACNTATAAAVQSLRGDWPQLPIVGVEPGLKPAVAASLAKNVGVLATPSTLRSGKFQRLLDQHGPGARVHLQPCPGLAGQIERGQLDDPALVDMIEAFCQPLREAAVDVVVLGCTHYAFVAHHIQRALGPGVAIVDTADAVARQAARLAGPLSPDRRSDAEPGSAAVLRPGRVPAPIPVATTGDIELLRHVTAHWLDFECRVSGVMV